MFDGIKILDLSVSTDALLHHNKLLFFGAFVRGSAEVVEKPSWDGDRGLTFTLVPTATVNRPRCELRGSLHRFHNQGLHNGNDFMAADLLATLDELVTTYAINPYLSRLNNVEFGVNVELPFPVSQVLDNLISYKYRPFVRVRENGDGYAYYQAVTEHYVVKVYDKGVQYNLGNVFRFEIKVMTMQYLARKHVQLNTLADLLNVANYGSLGKLLVTTFTEILFDEPTLDQAALTAKEKDVYLNGRNPRFWSQGRLSLRAYKKRKVDLSLNREYNAKRQWLYQYEKAYRTLIDSQRLRQDYDWKKITAGLIGQVWQRLTVVTPDLLQTISAHFTKWNGYLSGVDIARKSNNSTGLETIRMTPDAVGSRPDKSNNSIHFAGEQKEGQNSQIYPLYVEQNCEYCEFSQRVPSVNDGNSVTSVSPRSPRPKAGRKASSSSSLEESSTPGSVPPSPAALHQDPEPLPTAKVGKTLSAGGGAPAGAVAAAVSPSPADRNGGPGAPLTAAAGPTGPVAMEGDQSRPTATALRADAGRLTRVEAGRRRYAKGSKEDAPQRAAHNLRNDESNPRNNLSRRLHRLASEPGLFPLEEVVRLTDEQQALLDQWQGTAREWKLPGPPPSGASFP